MSDYKKRIAVFASGRGSNAIRMMEFFADNPYGEVVLVCSNNAQAPVLAEAEKRGVATYSFDRDTFYDSEAVVERLSAAGVHLVVLAGFIWKVPSSLIVEYPLAIVNIHPSLLPKFGGKGMYGMNVHEAVVAAKEPYTGITVHLIDDAYDQGTRLFQARVRISPEDDASAVAKKVLELEHRYYPKVVEGLCKL